MEVGACSAEHFRFQTKAELRIQEQWDDKCFTCQAFARELEAKVQLSRQVTEGSIVSIVAETCNRLVRINACISSRTNDVFSEIGTTLSKDM